MVISSCEKDEVVEPNDPVDEIVHPSVLTTKPTEITDNSAISGGNITDDGGAHIRKRGVTWNTSGEPDVRFDNITHDGSTDGKFTSEITGLDYATTYYVRAYAINSEDPHKVGYGQEREFTTKAISASIKTIEVHDVTSNSAMVRSEILNDGGTDIIERGIVWNEEENPTLEDNKIIDQDNGEGEYTINMAGLNINTTYYVKAYAVNEVDTVYGSQLDFTTLKIKPTVNTLEAIDITTNSAILMGELICDGGGISEKGIYFSDSPDPLNTDNKIVIDSENFEITKDNLDYNTTYYFKAYAKNRKGVVYGETLDFTTLCAIPRVEIISAGVFSRTYEGGVKKGYLIAEANATYDGNSEIVERGFIFADINFMENGEEYEPEFGDGIIGESDSSDSQTIWTDKDGGLGHFEIPIRKVRYFINTFVLTYRVRAYVITEEGKIGYSDTLTATYN